MTKASIVDNLEEEIFKPGNLVISKTGLVVLINKDFKPTNTFQGTVIIPCSIFKIGDYGSFSKLTFKLFKGSIKLEQ